MDVHSYVMDGVNCDKVSYLVYDSPSKHIDAAEITINSPIKDMLLINANVPNSLQIGYCTIALFINFPS